MKSLSIAPFTDLEPKASSGCGNDRKSLLTAESDCVNNRSTRSTVDGNKIRSRLLTRLGIVPRQQQPVGTAGSTTSVNNRSRHPMVRKVAPFSVPLKYDDDDDDDVAVRGGTNEKEDAEVPNDSTTTSSRRQTITSNQRRSVVAFDNEVSVVPIPKHQEYSKRIRSRLWCDKHELRNMAARNTLEYQSEGWHPSTVVEDEGFILMSTGEKIHPVHLQRLLSSPFFRQPTMRVMHLGCQQLEISRQPMV